MLLLEAMLMSVVPASTGGYIWVHGLDVAGGYVDACGLCYHLWLWRCQWSMLPPGAMLMSMDSAAAEGYDGVCGPCYPKGHVDVYGLCYCWRL